jgi:hypothetical protein
LKYIEEKNMHPYLGDVQMLLVADREPYSKMHKLASDIVPSGVLPGRLSIVLPSIEVDSQIYLCYAGQWRPQWRPGGPAGWGGFYFQRKIIYARERAW